MIPNGTRGTLGKVVVARRERGGAGPLVDSVGTRRCAPPGPGTIPPAEEAPLYERRAGVETPSSPPPLRVST